ncbi:MAG: response regulator [Desulfuromonadales bacterium]|nr:MAG: response regulator [Desulfuromonadales bacterium]
MAGTLRILHLEDDPADAELVRKALHADGITFDMTLVGSGEKFTAALNGDSNYDLILADMGIPGYDGFAALALARQRCPETPYIVVSGTIGEERAIVLLKSGATDFILKGSLGRLGQAVRRALAEAEELQNRRRAEGELRRLNAELEQRVAERTRELEAANRELQAFNYSVSHDLRAPLTIIDGFSKAVLDDCAADLPPLATEYLERVRAASQRMAQLIDSLLSFSRLGREPLKRETVDLSGIARTIEGELRYLHPERNGVSIRTADRVTAWGDRQLLRSVMDNLLGNAWKYTGKKERAEIEFGSYEAEGNTVYFVRDNGVGFSMRYADRLFTPFQRLHRTEEFGGIGIGLATVQRIISRHGGKVWVEAEEDKGATFYFTLR